MTGSDGLRLVLSEILRLRLRMTGKKSEGMTERLFHAFFIGDTKSKINCKDMDELVNIDIREDIRYKEW